MRRGEYYVLAQNDQLSIERRRGNVFQNGFTEGPILFKPTYKLIPGQDYDEYDIIGSTRIPAWTDRILWKDNSGCGGCRMNESFNTDGGKNSEIKGTDIIIPIPTCACCHCWEFSGQQQENHCFGDLVQNWEQESAIKHTEIYVRDRIIQLLIKMQGDEWKDQKQQQTLKLPQHVINRIVQEQLQASERQATLICYNSAAEVTISDHRPVFAGYIVKV
ncbi:MAG: hypothetical protein EZS28_016725 [Streblomastix strix]|uniref:Inositol polyphosphate-related phosphatase domain-containing protein n=1 Tax=Streblomastix strix TaxID=222440 RepID=A0A5J4VYS4_9EUKA|nr:MAG: hypothetical protein EZS28_016725 [Streblomastix strix]